MTKLLAVVAMAMLLVLPYAHGNGGSCWAPPFVFGSTCSSDTSIFGSPGHRVRYSVSVTGNGGTLVCCEARTCDTRGCRLRSIGCGSSTFASTVPWGNNLATPAVKCKGTPFGAFIRFSH
ncbi:uncharacterized protein LOC125381004 [Haliotis rufescens]|uniref:uncharacterized protein LOC125381004 n=1 Tax=Haliotis rufescens TaxID=6454 RepID=UPI00201F61BC|nr:uncharacterized protein LOC125381004 [Haliotis rufescens]